MNAPPPSDPQIAERLASTIELWAKIAGGVGAIWVLLAKVAKPYQEWRRNHLASVVRDVLRPELDEWRTAVANESSCARQMEELFKEMRELHGQMQALFADSDQLLEIARDNRDRHDEHDGLMDVVFSIDRRVDPERRKEIDLILKDLEERRRSRRRGGGEPE